MTATPSVEELVEVIGDSALEVDASADRCQYFRTEHGTHERHRCAAPSTHMITLHVTCKGDTVLLSCGPHTFEARCHLAAGTVSACERCGQPYWVESVKPLPR